MATQDDLIISIQADSAKAVAGLENIQKELKSLNDALIKTSKDTEKVQKATTDWGASLVKLSSAINVAKDAYAAMSGMVKSSIGEFITADDAANKLRNTLKIVGEKDVRGAVDSFEQFSKQLQQNSTVADDTSIEMLAMAKALRLSNEQAMQLVQTSADLAAVTGDDVKSSFESMLVTFKGQAGLVSKYAPELKNLTEAQLKHGDAVKLLGEKYAGFAKAQVSTIGGQLKQVQNLYKDTFEAVGGLFAEFFRLDNQSVAITALKNIIEIVNSLKPAISEARKEVDNFAGKVINGFMAMTNQAGALQAALIPIGVAMTLAFGPTAISSVLSMAAALASTAASAAALSANFLLITGAITGAIAAVNILYKNFGNLSDLASNLTKGFTSVFESIASGSSSAFSKAMDDISMSWKKLTTEFSFGFIGDAVKGVKEFMTGFNKEAEVAVKKTAEITAQVKQTTVVLNALSKEGQAAFDALAKKVDDLKSKQGELSQNVVASAEARYQAELKNLDQMQKQLVAADALNSASEKMLAQARMLAEVNKNQEIYNAQKKALDEIIEKNKDLQLTVSSIGATQQEIIQMQLARQLDLIEKKREELKLQGLLNEKSAAALDQQAALSKKSAQKASSGAPKQIQESLSMAGAELGKGITSAFAPMMGLTSGIGAYVAAAQAVVDAGPQLLESITHLIESITELPMKLLDGIQKLFDAVIKDIQNQIPNIIKAITGIIQAVIKFVKDVPRVIAEAIKQIPAMITDFIDQLPDMIDELVQALVEAGPSIAISTTEFLIKEAPKIALKMFQAFYQKVPAAIVNGIIEGLKSVGKMFKDLLSGKGFNLVDTKDIEKKLTEVVKKVSGAASRIFQVQDLSEQAKAALNAKNISRQVDEAGQKAADLLKKAWKWIWEKILEPFLDLLKKAWMWVWDRILRPIIDIVKEAWQWVWDKVIQPITMIVQQAWQWVWDKILKPFGENLKGIWNGIIENLRGTWANLINNLQAAFLWVSNLFSTIWDNLKKTWQTIMDLFQGKISFFDAVGKTFQAAFDSAKSIFDGFIKALNTSFESVGKIGQNIWDGFKTMLDKSTEVFSNIGNNIWLGLKKNLDNIGKFFTDAFDKISPTNLFAKIFKVDMGGRGTVEKALGIDVPFMSFARGGMVPGQAMVPGNSFMNDKILAMLSPGEAIVDREKMANPAIKAIIDAILDGKLDLPKFGWGVKDVAKAVTNSVSNAGDALSNTASNIANLTPSAAWEEIKKGGQTALDFAKSLSTDKLWDIVKDQFFSNFMHMFEMNKFATGGVVGDTIPAMLTPGEFVVSKQGVANAGVGALQAINSGRGGPQVINYNFEIPLTIENKGAPIDAQFIRQKILPTIEQELKRSSIEGRFVISGKGIRDA